MTRAQQYSQGKLRLKRWVFRRLHNKQWLCRHDVVWQTVPNSKDDNQDSSVSIHMCICYNVMSFIAQTTLHITDAETDTVITKCLSVGMSVSPPSTVSHLSLGHRSCMIFSYKHRRLINKRESDSQCAMGAHRNWLLYTVQLSKIIDLSASECPCQKLWLVVLCSLRLHLLDITLRVNVNELRF